MVNWFHYSVTAYFLGVISTYSKGHSICHYFLPNFMFTFLSLQCVLPNICHKEWNLSKIECNENAFFSMKLKECPIPQYFLTVEQRLTIFFGLVFTLFVFSVCSSSQVICNTKKAFCCAAACGHNRKDTLPKKFLLEKYIHTFNFWENKFAIPFC